jgi:hypothetical protein
VQAKSSAVGGRRVCKRRVRQTKSVAIERGKQKHNAKLLIRSKVGRHRNRCGRPKNCLKRPTKNREIAWTVPKRLGLRVFETGMRPEKGLLLSLLEIGICHIGCEHAVERSERSLPRHGCRCCVPNPSGSSCSWASAGTHC